MDLAYICEWEKWPKSTHCPSVPLACTWSCRNLIAFTTDLRSDDQDLTRVIHILDTEHPWDVHSICSGHSEAVTCLEWDQSGSRLLSADADGQIKCWSMADHLANSWESPVGSLVEGDPIVALSWLHNGVKLALHVEKSGASSFGEKFSRVKFSPSLTLFGGKPMEGWIAVTVSGLVTVSLLKPSGQVLTSTESLCRLRGRVALADIAFTGGGNIVVATADGSSASPVQFYKVCVSVVNEKCRIDTEILPSLFMRCTTDLNRRDRLPAITHLKFLARDMSEQVCPPGHPVVLLCASSQASSVVECWSLRKEGLPVNNIFQQLSPAVGDKQPTILKWRILSATNDLDRVSAVALPKLPISLTNTDLKVASDTQFYPGLGLALAFHDGSVHIVHRLSLQTMAIFYSSAAPRSVDEPAIKRPRTTGPAVHFKAMQLSWTSLALVGIDNHGRLSMLRISPSMGHSLDAGLALRHLLFLLEYCMVTGYDWWDILLHVQPSMVQSLVEKLHEEYTRQKAELQQVLSTRILAMKASLCKLSPCAVTRVCEYHAKLFLIAASSTLKSLLRPHVLNTPDKSPGDRLTEVCAKITDVDIDKVMINLKTEEFVLDMNTLQALQQLLQWVGDFVLYLLASLPNQGSPLRPGHSFLRDGASLGALRELMVVIRIWGLLKPSCLPVYTATSDTQDSMSLLFRLLTKLWICCRDEGPTSEPDEALVDECCLLPSQLLIPSLDWLPVSDGLVSRLQPKQPLRLHFGKPPALPGSATSLQLDGLIRAPGQPKMDHLRRLHLGAYPTEACKACTRCGCVTMLKSPNKTTAVKQWEQRWIKNCLCGGLWWRMPLSYP
ncbi:mediator of RNA polymerase II transcription subunit 16 isoform X1 [Delphinapterus leucas]|uniref:Mediator of RNA polymerase II transcription subunit 16 n=1 Tax=Delphinapterus leucas TaxID=9749 RepID=A0A7F8K8S1_DELLE|nr:mediator of RNA polymerase II transcription subunit 16 isoform X1 [Delphinapterus leucas]XP_030616529.1 mediator of RNA polymerase II transcription subunit 16 isoform X1 [Delphinapterus leucas]XP_030616530.1 mediator of RNA polymerase II transcription subunit 16 isoform X1 [Delphinapterus leucas]